jgi:hypothetical protein
MKKSTTAVFTGSLLLLLTMTPTGCGGSAGISEKLESSLKKAGYVIVTGEKVFPLVKEFLNVTIEDPRAGTKVNLSDSIKEEQFIANVYALEGGEPTGGKMRKVRLHFSPKMPKIRDRSVIAVPLDGEAKKTLGVALSAFDKSICDFVYDSLGQFNSTKLQTFENSDIRMVFDMAKGDGVGLFEIGAPVVRIEFKK